jgi:hypothetical protein
VVGLPTFAQLVTGLDPVVRSEYEVAAVAGLRVSHLVPAIVAIVGGTIAFFALGARDPVRSVFDLADERSAAEVPETALETEADGDGSSDRTGGPPGQ